jgi:hypothetical protein
MDETSADTGCRSTRTYRRASMMDVGTEIVRREQA